MTDEHHAQVIFNGRDFQLEELDPDARVLAEYHWGGYVISRLFDAGAQIMLDGGHVIFLDWEDDAVAWEWVPPSRVRLSWLLRRAFRRGNTWALLERELDPGIRVRARRILRGGGRIARGAVLLPIGIVRGRHAVVDALRGICFGAGSLAGVAGYRYDEYRTTHGG